MPFEVAVVAVSSRMTTSTLSLNVGPTWAHFPSLNPPDP